MTFVTRASAPVERSGADYTTARTVQLRPERLTVVPVELREANDFIGLHHRHHKPVVGHRFSVGIIDESGVLRGVAVVGRPVARKIDHHAVLDVTRCATDGVKNGCSALYGAAARVGKALGYSLIQTYILDSETGTSLRAAGWEDDGVAGGGQWKHTDGKPRRTDQPTEPKRRYIKRLNPRPADFRATSSVAA